MNVQMLQARGHGRTVVNEASTAPVRPSALTGDGSVAPSDTFDPSTLTVQGVLDWVALHPDQRASVLAAESAGKNRRGVVSVLETTGD